MIKSSIRDMVWSDHSIVLLSLKRSSIHPNLLQGRLNESLLSDPVRVTEIEKAIEEYFLLNTTAEVSAETLWAAHKATIQGKLIQLSTWVEKRTRDCYRKARKRI